MGQQIEHRILRYEKTKDREGNDEIFMLVEVDDGTDVYTRAEWLTKGEVAEILKDDKQHETHALKIAMRASKKRPNHVKALAHQRAVELAKIANPNYTETIERVSPKGVFRLVKEPKKEVRDVATPR